MDPQPPAAAPALPAAAAASAPPAGWVPGTRLHVGRGEVVVLALCLGALALAVRALPPIPVLVQFRPDALGSVADVMAPLVLIAAFIERAVEVVISGWREPRARELQAELEYAAAAAAGGAPAAVTQHHRAFARQRGYKADTLQIAFIVSFTLSLLVAMAGVRAVGQFLQAAPGGPQGEVLTLVDVLVTALMLAGGAEGIHRVVTAFTSFLDATRQRSGAAAAAAAPAVPAAAPGDGGA